MVNIFNTEYSKNLQLLQIKKVLKNCYLLLSLIIFCSLITATISFLFDLQPFNFFFNILIFYFLLITSYYLSDRTSGLICTIILSSFVGYTIGPILKIVIVDYAAYMVIFSFSSMTLIFFLCSFFTKIKEKNLLFLSSFINSGVIILLLSLLFYSLTNISKVILLIHALSLLLSSAMILWQINDIVIGGEKNYIRAAISIYLSLYNIFFSILGISVNFRRF